MNLHAGGGCSHFSNRVVGTALTLQQFLPNSARVRFACYRLPALKAVFTGAFVESGGCLAQKNMRRKLLAGVRLYV